MIRDHRGRTPRFVLIADPDGTTSGDRLILNQYTGQTARCNRHDLHSMWRACRAVAERRTGDMAVTWR